MTRALLMAAVLGVLSAGGAYAQQSVAASATVVAGVSAEPAQVAVTVSTGAVMVRASAPRPARETGTLEQVQVSRLSGNGNVVVESGLEVELEVREAEEIRVVVTRVIASNS